MKKNKLTIDVENDYTMLFEDSVSHPRLQSTENPEDWISEEDSTVN